MISPAIINTLLRLDGVVGDPPSPFERPNKKINFFILELGAHENVDVWRMHVAQALHRHAELLRDLNQTGARATLFVETSSTTSALRLEASFLSLLSEAGISLECYHGSD